MWKVSWGQKLHAVMHNLQNCLRACMQFCGDLDHELLIFTTVTLHLVLFYTHSSHRKRSSNGTIADAACKFQMKHIIAIIPKYSTPRRDKNIATLYGHYVLSVHCLTLAVTFFQPLLRSSEWNRGWSLERERQTALTPLFQPWTRETFRDESSPLFTTKPLP